MTAAIADEVAETPTGAGGQVAWASFEFARAPAVTLVFMFVFATYFTQTVVGDPVRGQAMWSLAGTIAGAGIALTAPLLGAAADRMGYRKPWLFVAVAVLVVATSSLWFAMPGGQGGLSMWAIVAVIVVIGIAGEVSVVIHNAMLGSIARPARVGALSGYGLAFSNAASFSAMIFYLFGIALPAMGQVHWAFLPKRPLFGLDPAHFEHARFVGPFGGLWLLLFAAPLFVWTPDRTATGVPLSRAIGMGLTQLLDTFRQARSYSNVGRFLLARMLYNDGIVALQTYCAIYAAGTFHWDIAAVLIFGLLIAAFCLGGSLLGGLIDSRIGSKQATILCLFITGALLVATVSISPTAIYFFPYRGTAPAFLSALPYFRTVPEWVFLGTFLCLGISASVVLVSARAMMARIAPRSLMTQFFGLFSLSGTATAFLGHGLVAAFTLAFHSQSAGFLAPIILLAAGMLIMLSVRQERAAEIPTV
jgi:UMF1 family MFS transporter